jgi:hypothetical protein
MEKAAVDYPGGIQPNWRESTQRGRAFKMNTKDVFDLTGRVAIITGSSVGLGRQMAEKSSIRNHATYPPRQVSFALQLAF